MQRGTRVNRVGILVESPEQGGGLLQATLANAQLREADRGRAPRRHAMVAVPGGFDELHLRLVPPARSGQDAAIVRTAVRGNDRAPLHALRRARPLLRTRDVVGELARRDEPAEDRFRRREVRQLTCAHRRHGLVAEHQAVLDTIAHDERATEIRQRHELDVGITEAASDRDRLAKQRLTLLGTGFGEGLDDQHPAVLGPILTRLPEEVAGARAILSTPPNRPARTRGERLRRRQHAEPQNPRRSTANPRAHHGMAGGGHFHH